MNDQLSEHFTSIEFQKNDPIPDECLPILQRLCKEIMEPVRDKFGMLLITSGYRSPNANILAHGQPSSEHVYTSEICAADFYSPDVPARTIFDWMRGPECASLPFHQLIYETDARGGAIIHVSMNKNIGTRSVLSGSTHNNEKYISVDHVAYTV